VAFVVVSDASALEPAPLRDLPMRVALTGLMQAKSTDQILAECFVNIAAQGPDLPAERQRRARVAMIQAVRDSMVVGDE